ncbi:MAG: hypothetical protein ACO1RT_11385 [Planctomycetaceae bacterium]
MLQRFAQYLIALFVLGTACAIYQMTFVAWVEPKPLPAIAMSYSPALRQGDTLEALFPADSWQRGNCKRLQTRDGVLLFENWQQMSDDQWKLWPISVVIGTSSHSPLVLEAAEGAEIKFTESLDVMSGGAPPIERGRMIGKVRIHSSPDPLTPATAGTTPARQIEIEAAEVGIDHRKVWTTRPIRLQLGDVELRGSDLTLHLSAVGGIVNAGDNALSVLDRLELIYLDQVTVPLADGGLWANAPAAAPSAAPPGRPIPLGKETPRRSEPPPRPGLATVQCGGSVVFHFASGELTMRDGVELRHQASIDSPLVDTFVCEELKLRFADLLGKRPRNGQIQDYLLSMVASGRPAKATLPGFEAQLAAGQIEWDTRTRLVRMGGQAGVLVSYAGNRWHFGKVNYLFHPQDPKLPGTFDAAGPGSMDISPNLDVPVTRLQWSGGVRLERIEAQDQLSLLVDGSVHASMADGGSLRCDSAQMTMQQVAAADDADSASPVSRLVPKHFQATGKVMLETPAIAVATKLLQLYFEMEPAALNANTAPRSPATPGQAEVAGSSGNLRQWIKQPRPEGTPAMLAGNSTPVPQARPSVHGDTIRAKIRLSADEVTAQDLTVIGDVALRHQIQTQSGPLPAVLTGDRLILSDGGSNDILQIGSGIDRPARFELGDGFFVGPLIQVRLADNVVWIKDAGEFQLPTQVLPRVGAIAARGALSPIDGDAANHAIHEPNGPATNAIESPVAKQDKIEWVSPPRCRWKGQMVFDGRTAVLTDGVEIHAAIVSGDQRDVWDLQLVGDQLQMVLDHDVRVREVESVKAATIDHVSITGTAANPLLVTANQLTSAGLRKARHVLAAPQLIMKPSTGSVSGPGPGWYRSWMLSDPNASFTQPLDSPLSMFGVHLVYQESLNADLKTQRLDFIRGIRIASRRVASWDDLIDVAQIQGLRVGESTLDCDRLRLSVDPTRSWAPVTESWEMEASGNIAFQSRNDMGLFSGTAERASYTAAKDIFLIEGVPSRAAVMNQTLPTGQLGRSLRVKRMTLNPKSMEIQNCEFDSFQLGTPPTTLGR